MKMSNGKGEKLSGEPKYLLIGLIYFDSGRVSKEVVVSYEEAMSLVGVLENAERKEFHCAPMLKGYRHRYYVDILDSLGREIESLTIYDDVCRPLGERKWFSFMRSDQRIQMNKILDEYLVQGKEVAPDKDAAFVLWNNQEGKTPVIFSDWHPGIIQSESQVHRKVLEEV